MSSLNNGKGNNLGLENLEDRTVPTAVMGWKGTLMVYGTTGDDNIQVTQSAGQIQVEGQSFNAALVRKICVYAGQGNDRVEVADNITIRAELYGDTGNDYLKGGSGGDLLSGGDGNDELHGGAGNDYLSGWYGDDLLDGGDGYDYAQDFGSVATDLTSIEQYYSY